MIIDIHTHMAVAGYAHDAIAVAECARLARRSGIDRVVYLFDIADGSRLAPSEDEVRQSNDLGMWLVREHPDLYLAFCYLDPTHDPAFVMAEMERCVAQGPLCGVKLWVAARATDARLDPIMRRAAKLGVPVLQHAWYKTVGGFPNESTPADVADLARRHPRTQIVMAHLDGVGWRGLADVRPFPNISVDTSGGQPRGGLVEHAVRVLGADRVLFGSDWPLRDFAVQKARITGARITARERERILGANAMRLLRRRLFG